MADTNKNGDVHIVVTPDAWDDLYQLVQPFVIKLADWGKRHGQPVAVVEGLVWGTSELVHIFGEGCDCKACLAVAEAVADEVVRRFTEGREETRH